MRHPCNNSTWFLIDPAVDRQAYIPARDWLLRGWASVLAPPWEMKTIFLLSPDATLAGRIATSLAGGERLLIGDLGALRPTRVDLADDFLLVADIRQGMAPSTTEDIQRLRMSTHRNLRCAFIMNSDSLDAPKLIGSIAGLATDIVLADVEPVGALVRAYLNDPDGGLAGVVALTILLDHLPRAARPMLHALLGSGFEVSSVKQCASQMRRERSALKRLLRGSSSYLSPGRVVDIAKASYAVVHISTSRCTLSKAATAVRFASSRSLTILLNRVFAITPKQILESRIDPPVLLRGLLRTLA